MPTDVVLLLFFLLFGLAAAIAAPILLSRFVAAQAERAVPPLGRITTVDGIRLHWAERGEGRPVILVHGLGAQMRSLTFPLFDDLAGDFHMFAIDRPGSGWSGRRPDGRVGLRADADTLAAFIRDRELERPLIVGHSLGGAVGLATEVHHPGLVGGLALVAPLTRVDEEVPEVFRPLDVRSPLLRRAIAETVAVPATLLRERALLREIFAPEVVPDSFGVEGGALLARRPEAYVTASTDLVAVVEHLGDVEAGYREIGVPVAVLHGRDDRILDPDVHGVPMRDRVPGATVEIVEGGHMLPFTQPQRVGEFVRSAARRVWAAD